MQYVMGITKSVFAHRCNSLHRWKENSSGFSRIQYSMSVV